MVKDSGLLERLKEYGKSDYYPFHMPGHKRQIGGMFAREFPNPFSIDITEIDGFDNLHHPEGILRESMEWAARVYGADRTYYLVNGSSCGILSAICGTTNNSDTILMSRNSHKSAYHGVFLNHLQAMYIYPHLLTNTCVQGGLLPDEIEDMLKTNVEISTVFVVSPTYDGIVSDIKTIANICHNYKIPLIVDEAHGAHFRYGKDLPVSALELGADVVIQSVHKTLPSLTQTALLHVKEGYVDVEKIERYLHIYQSSSPSYVLMAGIENCIRYMEGSGKQAEQTERMQAELSGRERMEMLLEKVKKLRAELSQMKNLSILGPEVIGEAGVYDLDLTKLIILTGGTDLTGARLERILRERYHLEMEMASGSYVIAMTGPGDTQEGMDRLVQVVMEIDKNILCEELSGNDEDHTIKNISYEMIPLEQAYSSFEAGRMEGESVKWNEASGRISLEYVYLYPPGIPMIVPGERITSTIVQKMVKYKEMGFSIEGLSQENCLLVAGNPE